MAETSSIEWTDATWNPWMGCTRVSPGCDFCYADRDMTRYGRDFNVVTRAKPNTFNMPLRLKEPSRIFSCSWSDFFIHGADAWREEAWEIILATPQHTYQILTKRPGLMVAWAETHPWPEHVWAGVSVESPKYLPRIDVLARVPASVLFVSNEPALEPLGDIRPWLPCTACAGYPEGDGTACFICGGSGRRRIGWWIAGGESGPEARPSPGECFTSPRDQCQAAGVAFFLKQWGEWIPYGQLQVGDQMAAYNRRRLTIREQWVGGELVCRLGTKAAGALLDGREHRAFPQ